MIGENMKFAISYMLTIVNMEYRYIYLITSPIIVELIVG
jgi:hypothetical protein